MINSKVVYLIRGVAETYPHLNIDELAPCDTTWIIPKDARMEGL